jgi:16S rRNA G966 N2-methylase RsmD
LLSPEFYSEHVQNFIRSLENEDPGNIVLKNKTIGNIPASFIADQVSGRKKAKEKLPLFYECQRIIFPPALNLEQSSSEITARYKTGFVAENLQTLEGCADLTGGFGVDSFFLSKVFKHVDYTDPEKNIVEIARHNHQQLAAKNITHHNQTAEQFLNATDKKFDLIFIDPSRRKSGNQKVSSLKQSEPDVVGLLETILEKTDHVLIKASPLLDIHQALTDLNATKYVSVVAVANECKEVLFFLKKGYTAEPLIRTENIGARDHERFDFYLSEERATISKFSEPMTYLLEPNTAILKSGAFKKIGERYALHKLHPSTHLYTTEQTIENFPGRVFKIEALVKPDPKELLIFFPDRKANVITRNYPLTPDALKKKTGIIDGGEKYLIGFSGRAKKHLAVASRLR